jgi:geranylgeranyl diphosphate synthase, type I
MSEADPSLTTFLARFQRPIERAIAQQLPRRLTARKLRRVLGPARYAYDRRALQMAIADPTWDLLDRGGKRWRPLLFLLILDLLKKDPAPFVDIAAALELIHNGTLVVDDVEDGSMLRRGKPALHRIYGTDVAVNAGNTLYFLPLLAVLGNRRVSGRAREQLLTVFIREMVRLHAGQGTDIAWHRGLVTSAGITDGQYLQMCAYKTGCLARMMASAAAILGGATGRQRAALEQFAETLGIVFQIQDDILNITPSRLSRRKGLGDDIAEGKRSLAVLHALRGAPRGQRRRLLQLLGSHTEKPSLRNEAIAIIRDAGGITHAERTRRRLLARARREFITAFRSSPARSRLLAFATLLAERDT